MVYLGLSCTGIVELRSPEKYLLAPHPSPKAKLIDQAAWERADVLFPISPSEASSPPPNTLKEPRWRQDWNQVTERRPRS
jgi:hypothetical protein